MRALALVLLLGLLAGAAGCGAVDGPSHYGWAQDWERERCLRDGNWWKPNDKLGGGGICDRVNMER